ncbi:hypothetical protein AOQ84DRAFT_223940 [Glonium stellatum]|uniref:Uncharacterized protein n=1 Tax=Glonium stellatum TaxID=574774 RepID=A0A8E2EWT3_9PEZI|nr:hypothetical protein AOQ84DRAFT_223940 [Glonium stellatum]
MRNMSAVGSPTLAIVQEDPPNATSPLSSHSSGHPFSPSHDPSARSGSQMANPTITTPQASQEGNTDISNPPPCPTSLARETHSADPTLPNSNNNSQQASRKPNAIKTLGRFIKNRISRLRDRFKRNKSRKSPNVVKPADSTSARESRPTSVQQNSTDEVQTPDPAASNTRQPEDNPPEETPPATVPSLSGDENQGPHRHIAIEFRGELPGLTHRERTALIRRTLTEQQSCTCNSNTCSCSCIRRPRPSSSVVPDNPLVDTASLYSDSPTQGSGQLINDFSLSGIGARFETTNTPSNTSNQIQVQNRSSIGTNLSGLTAVSWESSGGMTATSGPNRYPRARSLPGDAMHAPGPLRRQSNLRLRTNLQTDPEQEEQRVSNGFMERQSTDEDEYMPQEIDGERTPTQDDLSTTRSEALDRDSMDRGRSSIHRMLNGTNSSTSSETETTSAQGRASIDNEPRMNGERTPTDQHNHI